MLFLREEAQQQGVEIKKERESTNSSCVNSLLHTYIVQLIIIQAKRVISISPQFSTLRFSSVHLWNRTVCYCYCNKLLNSHCLASTSLLVPTWNCAFHEHCEDGRDSTYPQFIFGGGISPQHELCMLIIHVQTVSSPTNIHSSCAMYMAYDVGIFGGKNILIIMINNFRAKMPLLFMSSNSHTFRRLF